MFNSENRPAPSQNEHNSNGRKFERAENNRNFNEGNFAPAKNAKMTSLQLAKISGKLHKDVMRAIRNQEDAWTKVNGRNFALINYTDSRGRQKPMYELNKMESLYIASKFNDEVRARLVMRWHQLEVENQRPKNQVKLEEGEAVIFAALKKFLVRGDIKSVAVQLGVTPGSVSRVKRGIFRSGRIMDALLERCKRNKKEGLVDGYPNENRQTALDLFNPKNPAL